MDEQIIEEILKLFEDRKFPALREKIADVNPADVALIFEEIPKRDLPLLYRILPKELAADVFVEMEPDMQLQLIEAFSDRELQEVMDDMFMDDTVDIIEEMPANVVSRILKSVDRETRNKINIILNYPKDSAGSLMTIEYIDLKEEMTVSEALSRIRTTGIDSETIYTCYVTSARRLVGIVTVKDLLLADDDEKVADIMETNIISVTTHTDKEEVAMQFAKYDLLALPVVDAENRLVGIVTIDDAVDVIQDENTEDIEKMAAIVPTDKPYLKMTPVEIWKKRIPWLLILMISATFTSMIISSFEEKLNALVVLTSFIPMIMDTGGNSGGQASVTIIRGMSLGEIEMDDVLKVIWKEIRVALLCGAVLAVCSFGKVLLVDRLIMGNTDVSLMVSLVISLTLVVTIIMAKFVGCTLPMLAKKLGFDPAVMASPFITTIVDALALLVYFGFATLILKI